MWGFVEQFVFLFDSIHYVLVNIFSAVVEPVLSKI